ncbi:hypothetical protein GCM10010106_49790 [Thermopolyspora flexuosa]|jgi:hypothetical protein|uniref:Uncharacterized protein n=1 Tax=Thermopolyspora flexuosa TaxID=103836 RepID=A0A543IQE7_9ACTN|nr:hypothetical protein [Thermopolyspora flexuosa]TQM72794.1 hypothetical protein FHX40_4954 [Thermopolyspora flexuosa]GGM95073.1 hypothetical protein GCM10010106_49790 [Thermopolyspora flexuosa]
MRSRVTAVLLLLLCLLTGTGRNADEAARAVTATQQPPGTQDPALGQAPYGAALLALQVAKGAPTVGGTLALLPRGDVPARPRTSGPVESAGPAAVPVLTRSVAPPRAPPGASTR